MRWQENAVVYDCPDENSIFSIFDMQFLPVMAYFWQISAVVHDFASLKILSGQKIVHNRQNLPTGGNLSELCTISSNFHRFAALAAIVGVKLISVHTQHRRKTKQHAPVGRIGAKPNNICLPRICHRAALYCALTKHACPNLRHRLQELQLIGDNNVKRKQLRDN